MVTNLNQTALFRAALASSTVLDTVVHCFSKQWTTVSRNRESLLLPGEDSFGIIHCCYPGRTALASSNVARNSEPLFLRTVNHCFSKQWTTVSRNRESLLLPGEDSLGILHCYGQWTTVSQNSEPLYLETGNHCCYPGRTALASSTVVRNREPLFLETGNHCF